MKNEERKRILENYYQYKLEMDKQLQEQRKAELKKLPLLKRIFRKKTIDELIREHGIGL